MILLSSIITRLIRLRIIIPNVEDRIIALKSRLFKFSELILGHSDLQTRITMQVVGIVAETQGALSDVHMGPVVLAKRSDLLHLLVA